MSSTVDVAVIGAGPGGAAVANMIASAGRSVRLFERERFPRFHVGESLVPAVNYTLDRLGLLGEMDRRGYPKKHAVQFFSPRGPGKPFYFAEVRDPKLHYTWQVLRSDFDAMLLAHAERAGVETSIGVEVLDVLLDGETVTGVRVRDADGREEDVAARVVIDASGQQSLLSRRFRCREYVADLRNTSVFAHYRDVRLDDGKDAGSTLIFRLDTHSWIWLIPLPESVSIGLVAPIGRIASFGDAPTEILDNAIARCEPLAERLAGAECIREAVPVRDFSYRSSRDGGPGWALVGDALGFIDPIYSTGLFLTMLSAELAAEAVESAFAGGAGTPDLRGFSARFDTAFDQFLVLVRAYYREDFHFGEFSKDPEHRQGLVDLLTGVFETPEAAAVTAAIRRSELANSPNSMRQTGGS